MTNNSPTAPAGWYDDGTGTQRWWDGSHWTTHSALPPATPTTSVPGRIPGFVLGLGRVS